MSEASEWKRLSPSWPFNVARLPFYYGWVIAVLSTVGFVMSIPGQTMGIAVFTDTLIQVLGLSRTELSSAYFMGTLASALILTRAGRVYDRAGARITSMLAAVLLGISLAALAGLDKLLALFPVEEGARTLLSFLGILLVYFGVRFSGQGVLTSASRNVLLVWFERRRGLVSGVRGVFVTLAFASAPVFLAWMITELGWRGALLVLALVTGIIYPALCLVFLRDDPRSCGLRIDGGLADQAGTVSEPIGLNVTLPQAKRTLAFWLYSLALGLHGLLITAFTFHVVAVFEYAGRSELEAFRYFLPAAAVSVTVNILASALVDTRRLRPFLLAMVSGLVVGMIGLLMLKSTLGYWLMVGGFGLGGGLWGVLSNLGFIRHFGARHLGEISGFNMTIVVIASAIGPLMFSLALDMGGDFDLAIVVCLVAGIGLLLVAALFPVSEAQPGGT